MKNLKESIRHIIREFLNEEQEILLAPNGNVSNLPKSLYNYVRTEEFKKWFGDWESNPNSASKIIDENGEPMLVFHGTENVFQEFDRKKLRLNYFYFTKKQDYAARFGENIKGCFLNVKKIKDAKEVGTDKITIPKLFKILGFKTEYLQNKHLYTYEKIKEEFWIYLKYYDEIYNNLKWRNYDCVNFFENYTEDGGYDETEVFAVFYPEQIKCVG